MAPTWALCLRISSLALGIHKVPLALSFDSRLPDNYLLCLSLQEQVPDPDLGVHREDAFRLVDLYILGPGLQILRGPLGLHAVGQAHLPPHLRLQQGILAGIVFFDPRLPERPPVRFQARLGPGRGGFFSR
jgi:hypothetical protein